MKPETNGHDPVAANRAAHPRRTPGREPLGLDATRRVGLGVAAVLLAATAILVVALSTAR